MTHELNASGSTLTLSDQGKLTFRIDGGAAWENHGPLLVVHYYDRQHPRAQQALVPGGDSHAYGTAGTLSLSAKGILHVAPAGPGELKIQAVVQGAQIQIDLRIVMEASGRGFRVVIDEGGGREDHPRLYRLLGIEVLPEFGAARTGEAGYLTLPNWFGCQTFFNADYPREVRQSIYSTNDQWEHVCHMPVFGITRSQGTLCGIVAAGDVNANLVCRRHWERQQANSVHPHLVYRWEQSDEIIAGPREVRYSFAPPNYEFGEGYVFLGREYRRMLQQERGLLTWAQKAARRPEAMDYCERFFLKIFMAYKDPNPQGTGPYHCTCTFDEAIEILAACQARGMKKITAVLVGWGQDGHDGQVPTYLPVDDRVGGEAGMRKIVQWCREHDVLLGVHTSHHGTYTCSPEFNLDEVVRHRTGEYWESVIWSGGQVHQMCPTHALRYVRRDLPALAALGLHGHHHYDAVGSFMTCHDKRHPVTLRQQYIDAVREEFRIALDTMGSVSTEMPFGPYFDLVDGFFHSFVNPYGWHRASSVGQYFYDRTAPLLSVVLHGSVNCGQHCSDERDWLLEALDMGLTPQFEVCMRPSPAFGIPAYTGKADMLAKVYDFCYGPAGVIGPLTGATIEGRWELAPGVTKTLYSGGKTVRVNRSGQAFGDLPAGSYKVEG